METPPRPSSTEVQAALSRIWDAHERDNDPYRAEMGTEPRAVLDYLRRQGLRTPRDVAVDDIREELTLLAALRWELIDRERALLRRARHLGVSYADLGARLGIGTRQGMRDYLDRLESLAAVGVPDVTLARHARHAQRARPADQRWIGQHRDEVRDVIGELLRQLERVLPTETGAPPAARSDDDDSGPPEHEASWVDELRSDLDDDTLTPATLGLLGLVLGEVRAHPAVAALDPAHGLARAVGPS